MDISVAKIDSWRNMSLHQLSQVFGIARETVMSRITSGRVSPSGEKGGHAVYDVSQVYRAIRDYELPSYSNRNPNDMPPKERRDWFESENARLKMEKETGRLIDAEQVRQMMADLVKPGIQLMETIPDILERDYSQSTKAVMDIEKRIDELRKKWANEIEELCTQHPA